MVRHRSEHCCAHPSKGEAIAKYGPQHTHRGSSSCHGETAQQQPSTAPLRLPSTRVHRRTALTDEGRASSAGGPPASAPASAPHRQSATRRQRTRIRIVIDEDSLRTSARFSYSPLPTAAARRRTRTSSATPPLPSSNSKKGFTSTCKTKRRLRTWYDGCLKQHGTDRRAHV